MSALMAEGHPYNEVMSYPIAKIWAEYHILELRTGARMADESLLMQTMLSAWFSGKGEPYKKQLEKVRNGW